MMYTFLWFPKCIWVRNPACTTVQVSSLQRNNVSCRQKLSDNVKTQTEELYLILPHEGNLTLASMYESCFCARCGLSHVLEEASEGPTAVWPQLVHHRGGHWEGLPQEKGRSISGYFTTLVGKVEAKLCFVKSQPYIFCNALKE